MAANNANLNDIINTTRMTANDDSIKHIEEDMKARFSNQSTIEDEDLPKVVFNPAELQAIERMSLVFEALVFDDVKKARLEVSRVMSLIFAKDKPATFIQELKNKASNYVERTKR